MGTLNAVEPSGQDGAADNLQHSISIPAERLVAGETAAKTDLGVQTSTYFSWSAMGEIMSAWEQILQQNPTLSIFSTPEWLRAWWEAFGSNRRLIVLVFSDSNGRVIGLAPMYSEITKHTLFGHIRELRLVGDGSGDSDNLDLILRSGEEKRCVAAFLGWIARNRNAGICALNTLPANSLAAKELQFQLEAEKWSVRHTTTANSVVPLPVASESYLESLPPKFRRQIARCRRRAESLYQVRLRRCESESEIPLVLDALYCLHQKRWNSVREPGSFLSTERRDLYARMAKAFFDRGWLELWSLELNGRAVAVQMNFRYRDCIYALQEGFDTDFADLRVGFILRAATLENFISRGATAYDFLGGFNAQKQRWGAQPGAYSNLQFATPRSMAAYCLAFEKTAADAKEWLRGHLPPAGWNVLHRLNLSIGHADSGRTAGTAAPSVDHAKVVTQGATLQ